MPSWSPTVRTAARVTSNILQARRVVDMDKDIGHLDPSSAPLLRLIGDASMKDAIIPKKVCRNPKYDWIQNQHIPRADAINNGAGYLAGDTALVVDNAAYFVVDQSVHVPRTGETMKVTAINVATNTLTVSRGVGATPGAALLDNDELRMMGTSAKEFADTPSLRHPVEIGLYNYTQIHRTPWGFSRTEMNSELYGGPDEDEQMLLKGIEHSVEIEQMLLFGDRGETISADTNDVNRFSGGFNFFITQNVFDFLGGLINEQDMASVIQTAFRYNSKDGSRKSKFFICSRLYLSALEYWYKGLLRLDPGFKQYGIEVYDYVSGNGRLKFVPHDLLTGSVYGGRGYIVDMPYLSYRFLANSDTKLMRNRQGNGVDGVVHEYLTECGLQVKIDDAHAIVDGVTGYA